MSDDILLSVNACHPNMNFNGPDGCNKMVLVITRSEIEKLQTSVLSQDKPVPDIDYSVAAQFWGLAFTTTFFLWLFAKGIGEILKQVRNA